MKKIYLITLTEFGGEKYVYYFENKEWYDWIFTNEIEALPSMIDFLSKNKKLMEDYNLETKDDVIEYLNTSISPISGSFENDKAILVSQLSKSAPNSNKRLLSWLNKNNFEIVKEYEGMIY